MEDEIFNYPGNKGYEYTVRGSYVYKRKKGTSDFYKVDDDYQNTMLDYYTANVKKETPREKEARLNIEKKANLLNQRSNGKVVADSNKSLANSAFSYDEFGNAVHPETGYLIDLSNPSQDVNKTVVLVNGKPVKATGKVKVYNGVVTPENKPENNTQNLLTKTPKTLPKKNKVKFTVNKDTAVKSDTVVEPEPVRTKEEELKVIESMFGSFAMGGELNKQNTFNNNQGNMQQEQQMMQAVAQMLQQMEPNAVVQKLMENEIPQEQATQLVQQVMQMSQQQGPPQMAFGGRYMYEDGGQQPQQGGDQMQQIMQQVQQMVEQGAQPTDIANALLQNQMPPETVMQVLVEMGMPEQEAQATIQQAMQGGQQQQGAPQEGMHQMPDGSMMSDSEMEGQEQQQPSPEEMAMMEQQQAPENPMMAFGGPMFDSVKKTFSKSAPQNVNSPEFVQNRQADFINAVKRNTLLSQLGGNNLPPAPGMAYGGTLPKAWNGNLGDYKTKDAAKLAMYEYNADPANKGKEVDITKTLLDWKDPTPAQDNSAQTAMDNYTKMLQQYLMQQQQAMTQQQATPYGARPLGRFLNSFTGPGRTVINGQNVPVGFNYGDLFDPSKQGRGTVDGRNWEVTNAEYKKGLFGRTKNAKYTIQWDPIAQKAVSVPTAPTTPTEQIEHYDRQGKPVYTKDTFAKTATEAVAKPTEQATLFTPNVPEIMQFNANNQTAPQETLSNATQSGFISNAANAAMNIPNGNLPQNTPVAPNLNAFINPGTTSSYADSPEIQDAGYNRQGQLREMKFLKKGLHAFDDEPQTVIAPDVTSDITNTKQNTGIFANIDLNNLNKYPNLKNDTELKEVLQKIKSGEELPHTSKLKGAARYLSVDPNTNQPVLRYDEKNKTFDKPSYNSYHTFQDKRWGEVDRAKTDYEKTKILNSGNEPVKRMYEVLEDKTKLDAFVKQQNELVKSGKSPLTKSEQQLLNSNPAALINTFIEKAPKNNRITLKRENANVTPFNNGMVPSYEEVDSPKPEIPYGYSYDVNINKGNTSQLYDPANQNLFPTIAPTYNFTKANVDLDNPFQQKAFGGVSNNDLQKAAQTIMMAFGGGLQQYGDGGGNGFQNGVANTFMKIPGLRGLGARMIPESSTEEFNPVFKPVISEDELENMTWDEPVEEKETSTIDVKNKRNINWDATADMAKIGAEKLTNFFNADLKKQKEREIAVRSAANSPSDQLGNQGYDQFGNFLGGTDIGAQVLNPTNTAYNERMPIYKLGGKTYYALGGELYDADADYDLSDDDIEALRKIGYSVKKN